MLYLFLYLLFPFGKKCKFILNTKALIGESECTITILDNTMKFPIIANLSNLGHFTVCLIVLDELILFVVIFIDTPHLGVSNLSHIHGETVLYVVN